MAHISRASPETIKIADNRVNACTEQHVMMKFPVNKCVKPMIFTEGFKYSTLLKISVIEQHLSDVNISEMTVLGCIRQ